MATTKNNNNRTKTNDKAIPSSPRPQRSNEGYAYDQGIRNDPTVSSQQPYTPRVAPPDKGTKK